MKYRFQCMIYSAQLRRASSEGSSAYRHDRESLNIYIIIRIAPPFKMFIIGTGNSFALKPPRYANNGKSKDSAAARAKPWKHQELH